MPTRWQIVLWNVLLSCLALPAAAHLAIVRQGVESADIPNVDDRFGRAVAAGDFNGDGYDDLATAAPDEANGLINTAVHGIVIVNEGSPYGLTHTGAYVLTVGGLPDPAVRYGWALAVADFDGDGYDDLAVGLPDMDLDTSTDAGQVWIHRGGPNGLSDVPALVLDQGDVPGAAIEALDHFGWSLAAGDFDGDMTPDLAVGAIGEDNGAGAVFFFDVSGPGVSLVAAGFFKQSNLGGTNDAGDSFGWSLVTGDFDGSGHDELAVGAPGETVASLPDAGRVTIIFGSPTGLSASNPATYDDASLGLVPLADAKLGFSMAAGHFWEQTGPPDLAIGAPRYDQGGANAAGRVVVLEFQQPPTKAGPARTQLVPTTVALLHQGSTDPVEAGDEFGYAMAAGQFDLDGRDDLAVGAPFEDRTVPTYGATSNAGMLHVFDGSAAGPRYFSVVSFTAQLQNDATQVGDAFGQAVAFGKFDGGSMGRSNLAVGLPGRDYVTYDGAGSVSNAGQVTIIAPWRQFPNKPHRASVAYDCDQNIVYSQRMFQRLRPASTTKTMTLLLACEAIAAGLDPDTLYTVPLWAAMNVGGSQVPLNWQEKMSLGDLMKTMMTVSGNDAAYCIADLLTPGVAVWDGYDNTVPAFATMMNNKAAALGMGSTTLTNPAGLDVGNHYTTALDFAKLTRAAMQNACVREIVGKSPWVVDRDVPPWYVLLTPADTVKTVFYNGFVDGIRNMVNGAHGVKGGETPGAWKTGLWSSVALGGEVQATAFGIRSEDVPDPGDKADSLTATGAGLLSVAKAACDADDLVLPPPPPPIPFAKLQGVSTQLGAATALVGVAADLAGDGAAPLEEIVVEVVRQAVVQPMAAMKVAVQVLSNVQIPVGDTVILGIAPYQQHAGIRLSNQGEGTVQVDALVSDPASGSFSFTMAPFDTAGIAPTSGAPGTSFALSLTNNSARELAVLDVEIRGFVYDLQLGPGGLFEATFQRSEGGGITYAEDTGPVVQVFVFGQDTVSGNSVGVGLRTPDVPSDALELPSPRLPGPRLLSNVPNPFNPATRIRFELDRRGSVQLTIYDLAGKRVRRLGGATELPAGLHGVVWDGRDDAGRAVPSGIYFVKLQAAGSAASGKIALVR